MSLPTINRASFRRDHVLFAVGILLFACLVYARALVPGQTFIADVLFRHFLGQYSLLKQALASHELPYWNPYVSGGTPLLASAHSSLFYPATYLFALFDFGLALKWHVILHGVLSAVAMALLAGSLGLKPSSARMAGLIYAFNGFAVMHFQLPDPLQVYALTPLVVYAIRHAVLENSRRGVPLAALCLALLFFAGYVPLMIYAVFIACAMTFCTAPRLTWKMTRRTGLLFLLAVGLAAVQIGPTLCFALESSRAATAGQEWVLAKSLQWGEIFRMTFYPLWDWYLHFNVDTGIAGFYWGYGVLILAALGLRRWRTSRLCQVLLGLAGLGIILAAGKDGLLYPLLAKYVWPFNWLRYPANALILTNFAVALLAGIGLEQVRGRARYVWIAACAADLVLFSWRAYETIDASFYRLVPPTAAYLQRHREEGRIYMTPPATAQLSRYGNTRYEAYTNFADSIMPSYAPFYRLYDAGGGGEFEFERHRQVMMAIEQSRASPWLNVTGARFLLSFRNIPGLPLLWQGPSGIKVLKNDSALPRAYFISQAAYLPSIDSFEAISAGHLDVRKQVLLNDRAMAPPATGPLSFIPLQVQDVSPNHLRISVTTGRPGWVVLSDSFDRGWKAAQGRAALPIYRANYIQQAVAVPAGESTIDWTYRPPGWEGWMLASFFSVLAIIAVYQ